MSDSRQQDKDSHLHLQQRRTTREVAKTSRCQQISGSHEQTKKNQRRKRRSSSREVSPDVVHFVQSSTYCVSDPSVCEPKTSKHRTAKKWPNKQLDCGSCINVTACLSSTNDFDSVVIGRAADSRPEMARQLADDFALTTTQRAESGTDTTTKGREPGPATSERESATRSAGGGRTETETSRTATAQSVGSLLVGNTAVSTDKIRTVAPANRAAAKHCTPACSDEKQNKAVDSKGKEQRVRKEATSSAKPAGLIKAFVDDSARSALGGDNDNQPCVPTFKAPQGAGEGGSLQTSGRAGRSGRSGRQHLEVADVRGSDRRFRRTTKAQGSEGGDANDTRCDVMGDVTWDLWRENIQAATSFRRRSPQGLV